LAICHDAFQRLGCRRENLVHRALLRGKFLKVSSVIGD